MLKFTPKTKQTKITGLPKSLLLGFIIFALGTVGTHAQGGVCGSVLECKSPKKRYINKIPIDGHPAGSVCADLYCGGPTIRYFYREEGETCNDVYGSTAEKRFEGCKEFLTHVNGKKANRFFKKFKPDDFQKYTPSEVEIDCE